MKTKSLINSSRFILFKEAVLSKRFWLSDFAIIGYIALVKLVLHLVAIQGYGYFRDEFYYIACSDHLAFGYVDHPSLSIFLLKIVRLLFGDSLVAIRILPVISGALFVFFTGLIARELGGRKFAMILASISAAKLNELVVDYRNQISIIQLDVSDLASIESSFETISEQTDELDLLINNARDPCRQRLLFNL